MQNPNPNQNDDEEPLCYRYLPDDDELVTVLDRGGNVPYNKIVQKDLYSDHVWVILRDMAPVILAKVCEFVIDSVRHPLEDRPGEFRGTIDNGAAYWEQSGGKSCITNKAGAVVGIRTNFVYVIGNKALKNAGAHKTSWRMTEIVSLQGNALRSICKIRNCDKGVVSAAAKNKKAYLDLRNAQDKHATGMLLIEERAIRAGQAASKADTLQEDLDRVRTGFTTAQTALLTALDELAVEYDDKVLAAEIDLWVLENESDQDEHHEDEDKDASEADHAEESDDEDAEEEDEDEEANEANHSDGPQDDVDAALAGLQCTSRHVISNEAEAEADDAESARHQTLQVGMQVYLKSSSSSSHVVAKGRVKSLNPNSVVGNKKVGRNWSEVVIEVVLKRNEMLLRKHSLLRTLEDAIGVAVAWPCSLIYSVVPDEDKEENDG